MSEPDERLRRRQDGRRRLRRRRLLALIVVQLGLAAAVAGIAFSLLSDGDSSAAGEAEGTGPGSDATSTTTEQPTTVTRPTTPTTAPPAEGLAHVGGRVIVIDPGHNGHNYLHSSEINKQVNAGTLWKACDTTGTQTYGGYTEAEYNLDVARRLEKILTEAGAKVVLTRRNNEDWGPCITERAAIGNRAHGDVAISIHADGGPDLGRGFHVIYPPALDGLTDDIASESRRLALAIRAAFRTTGMPEATYVGEDGLNVRDDLGGLNLSDVPKVLFETGNMRNSEDAALLTSAEWRQRSAGAIARGLDAFLGQR